MTQYEAVAQMVYRIRVAVDDVVAFQHDLHYFEQDGRTMSPENINYNPYTATFQAGGQTITIRARGWGRAPSPPLTHGRELAVTASAPFLMAGYTSLFQVITSDGSTTGYDVVTTVEHSDYNRSKGANSTLYDSSTDNDALWANCQVQNKFTFGGEVFVNLHFCTHLPLRDRETGQLLRDITTGKILIDC